MPIEPQKLTEELGIQVYGGGRVQFEEETLTESDISAIDNFFDDLIGQLRLVSSKIADLYRRQREVIMRFAGVAKATFPERKNFSYPSQTGTIGMVPIIPQALKYTATPSDTEPAYTSYKTNSYDIDIVAGTPAYFLGDGTNFYKASPTTEKHSFMVILKNGIIEIGTTPSIEQFRVYTDKETKWGIFTPHILAEMPIEDGKLLYQYNTIAAIPVDHVSGTMFGFMPRRTGTMTVKLVGVVFYEHAFLPDLTWR